MYIILLLIGFAAGILGGFFGIGGGLIIIPALIYLLHFSPKIAQGTTLAAMIPPIGLLAAFVYWKAGHVNIIAAFLIAAGFFIGGFFGGMFAQHLPDVVLKRAFAILLIAVAVRMFFK